MVTSRRKGRMRARPRRFSLRKLMQSMAVSRESTIRSLKLPPAAVSKAISKPDFGVDRDETVP